MAIPIQKQPIPTVSRSWKDGLASYPDLSPAAHGYFNRLAMRESGGRNIGQQVNNTGTAFGPFQFTKATWNGLTQRHPELGLTENDRYDPYAQGRAIPVFTQDNALQLKQALGRDPTPADLTAAHALGAGGAIKLLKSNPNQSFEDAFPEEAKANPQWRGSVADVMSSFAGVANGTAKTSAPAQPSQRQTTPIGQGGLAELMGISQVASSPVGDFLENMTPQYRNMLVAGLKTPGIGPEIYKALLDTGLRSAATRQQQSVGFENLTPSQRNALSLGLRPGMPEWDAYIRQDTLGAERPAEAPKVITLDLPGGKQQQAKWDSKVGDYVPFGPISERWQPPQPKEPKEPPAPRTTVQLLMGDDGKPHRFLINGDTGEKVKDLGLAPPREMSEVDKLLQVLNPQMLPTQQPQGQAPQQQEAPQQQSSAPANSAPAPSSSTSSFGPPPKAAIDFLLQNPDKADKFDEMYGKGSAATFLRK